MTRLFSSKVISNRAGSLTTYNGADVDMWKASRKNQNNDTKKRRMRENENENHNQNENENSDVRFRDMPGIYAISPRALI